MKQVFGKSQCGFSKDKSRLTNQTTLNRKVLSAHMGRAMYIVYLDVCKAFDTVFHSLFLDQLTR